MSQAETAHHVRLMAVELAKVYKAAGPEYRKQLRRMFFLAFAGEFGKDTPSREAASDLMALANEVLDLATNLYRQVGDKG